MNILQKQALRLILALAGIWFLQDHASAQTMTINIREPAAGNPTCTAKVTLKVVDASGTVLATFYPTSGVYNFTMPAIANADKRVTLQFQRVVGTTSLAVSGVNGAYSGSQKFDLVIP